MTKETTADLIHRLALESDETINDPMPNPLPAGVTVIRGGQRTRTLQVRMSDAEYAELEAFANRRQLPPSTAARSILLAVMKPSQPIAKVLDRIEQDVQALRGELIQA
jgi:hypothetical protein